MITAPTSIAAYCRVSGEEQRERQSIETQRDWLRRYFDLHGLKAPRWFEDEGWSGTIPFGQRPGGAALLAAAAAGRIQVVYVYRIDRIARDPRLILDVIHALEQAGVAVKSATEAFDTSSPAGKAMLGMLSVFAGFERDSIRERCVAGQERAARAGTWMGGPPPYGYRVVGENRDARLVPDADPVLGASGLSAAEVVQLGFDLSSQGKSCAFIAEEWNRLGVLPPLHGTGRISYKTGRPVRGHWTSGTVLNIIRNETYSGQRPYRGGSGTVVQEVPALVSREIWEQAQATLKRNQFFPPGAPCEKYLLRGLIYCGKCQRNYSGCRGSYKTKPHYKCNPTIRKRHGLQACRSPFVPRTLEEQVWSDCLGFLQDHDATLAECARGDTREGKGEGPQLQRTQQALAAKVAERNRLFALYRRGGISDADLDHQLAEVDAESQALEQEAARLQAIVTEGRATRQALQSASDWLEEVRGRLGGELTWEERKAIVDLLVKRITVYGEMRPGYMRPKPMVEIEYRFDSLTIAREFHL